MGTAMITAISGIPGSLGGGSATVTEWNCLVDTSRQDAVEELVNSLDHQLAPRSVVVLEST